jgi:phage terminase Nu1 subunit (DNA packaging protein)
MSAQTYPLDTISKLLDLTPQRVNQLVNQGIIPRAERGRYELVPVVRAYIHFLRDRKIQGDVHGDDYSTYRTRLTKARAEMAEKENAQLDSKLIPADDAKQAWSAMVANARARLLSIPNKIAPIVCAAETINEAREIIKIEIYEALNELADVEIKTINPIRPVESESDEFDGSEDVEITTESNGEQVGRSESETQP